jgi:DNA-binding NtrC family response regulator
MSTVLIVEDDFAILFVAESSLRIEGYDTIAAATRKDALAVLRSDQPVDVLFTDINLRGEKRAGLALAEKAVELRPELGVIYTTGGDVRSPTVEGSDFLPKPYTSSQLIDAVGHVLGAARELANHKTELSEARRAR